MLFIICGNILALNTFLYICFPITYQKIIFKMMLFSMTTYTRCEIGMNKMYSILPGSLILDSTTSNTDTEHYISISQDGKITKSIDLEALGEVAKIETVIKNVNMNPNPCILNNIWNHTDTLSMDDKLNIVPIKCNYRFINIKITLMENNTEKQSSYDIKLHDDISSIPSSFYCINNVITSRLIWYLLTLQHEINPGHYRPEYGGGLIDHCVNMVSFTNNDKIILYENEYLINK